MLRDLPTILYWWSLLFALGVVFLPLTRRLFSKFFDQGYAFSKILGILLVSYSIWLFGSLKLLPFFSETIWLVIIAFAAVNYFKKSRSASWRINIKTIILEEGLFLICLVTWSWVRGFQPAIQGLEKYMDYGFVNSLLRSRFFPPQDMWFSNETINYYYFGHLAAAVLTKLSGLDSAITYNLMIATIFGLTFTAGFSLAANLANSLWAGVLSSLLLSLGGNLHLFWYWLKNKSFAGYWYPDATRFIVEKFGASDNTIHEFPIYSFVVADLHGHLSNLPFVLLFLALVLVVFQRRANGLHFFLVSLLLAVFYITNAWDVPIYLLVFGLILLWQSCQKYGFSFKAIFRAALSSVFCLLFSALFSLPFHLNFKSLAEGVALVDFRSPLRMLLVLWGWPLFLTLIFLAGFRLIKRKPIDIFIAVLLIVSWLLIALPEFIYVKDIYINSYQRANTVFKLTYQAFVMFSLVSGYIIVRSLTGSKNKVLKLSFFIFYFLFFIFLLAYSYFSVKSYYGLRLYQSLNGLDYLRGSYPDDYQAILWLKKNIKGQPVILEAVGESYTDYARVSANTGLPTILGWPVHEWLWRGGYDQPGKRREEVRQIYEAAAPAEAQNLLTQYDVNYVFLGSLEKEQYKNLNEANFSQLGKVIYQFGKTKIYQLF